LYSNQAIISYIGLVRISISELINFISENFGGRISDAAIVEIS